MLFVLLILLKKEFAIEVIIDNHFVGYLAGNSRGRGTTWSRIEDEPTMFTKRSATMKKSNAETSDEFIYEGKHGRAEYRYCDKLTKADSMIKSGYSPFSSIEFDIVQL